MQRLTIALVATLLVVLVIHATAAPTSGRATPLMRLDRGRTAAQREKFIAGLKSRQAHGELRIPGPGMRQVIYKAFGKTSPNGPPIEPMVNYFDEVWVGNISAGTPSQPGFRVVMDTGSANLWIPAANCTSKGCSGKTKYSASASSTSAPDGTPFAIPYGTGFVDGVYDVDTVGVGGVSVPKQYVGQATFVGGFFEDQPLDGILGLGFKDIAVGGKPTVFDGMVEQGIISKPMFSVYLSNHENTTASKIIFGATDPSLYTGSITYVDVLIPSYWLVDLASVSVNNEKVHKCIDDVCLAVIDTGTSIIAGPPPGINPIIKKIGNVEPDCSNINSLPTVSFELGGHDFPLDPSIYVIKETFANGTTTCVLGMEGLLLSSPFWILGDPFLRAYYSVYDKGSNGSPRVGFAKAVQP